MRPDLIRFESLCMKFHALAEGITAVEVEGGTFREKIKGVMYGASVHDPLVPVCLLELRPLLAVAVVAMAMVAMVPVTVVVIIVIVIVVAIVAMAAVDVGKLLLFDLDEVALLVLLGVLGAGEEAHGEIPFYTGKVPLSYMSVNVCLVVFAVLCSRSIICE